MFIVDCVVSLETLDGLSFLSRILYS